MAIGDVYMEFQRWCDEQLKYFKIIKYYFEDVELFPRRKKGNKPQKHYKKPVTKPLRIPCWPH